MSSIINHFYDHFLRFVEDPTGNSDGFYSDISGNCFYFDDLTPMMCQFHTNKQMKHNEGWFYCEICEREAEY